MDEPVTYRWVSGPDDASRAARALRRSRLSNRRTWVVLSVTFVVTGIPLFRALDDAGSTLARLGQTYAVIGVIWLVMIPLVTRIAGRSTARLFGKRISAGTELTSRFGPDTFELAGPLSRHEYSYADLERVRRVDDWVFLRQPGSNLDFLWPAALFPDHELARLQTLITSRAAKP